MRKAKVVRAKELKWEVAESVTLGKEIGWKPDYESSLKVRQGISSKTVESPRISMSRGLIPAGFRNEFHYHPNSDVGIHVLKGGLKALLGPDDQREEVILEEGDFLFIPAGTIHAFMSVSDTEPVEFVNAKSVSDTKGPGHVHADSRKQTGTK